jgi:hypothetical protein
MMLPSAMKIASAEPSAGCQKALSGQCAPVWMVPTSAVFRLVFHDTVLNFFIFASDEFLNLQSQ